MKLWKEWLLALVLICMAIMMYQQAMVLDRLPTEQAKKENNLGCKAIKQKHNIKNKSYTCAGD